MSDNAMTAPVRLRGEVGERRKGREEVLDTGRHWSVRRNGGLMVGGEFRVADRRGLAMLTPGNVAARVDAIVAHFKAALAELQEQSRADRAEVAGLRAENERLREAVAKAANVIERKDADMIRYAAAGECEG